MLKTYKCVYDSGSYWILARNDEEAAWRAQEHAVNCGWKLIDVIPHDKKQEALFS